MQNVPPYLVRQGVDLGQRLGQAVRDLHVLAPELSQQLHVVVAGHAEGRAMDDHVPHQPHGVEDAGAAVHQVAEEDRLAAFGMDEGPVAPERIVAVQAGLHVPESREQFLQLVAAAVNIADDVERAVLVSLVVPERHPLDDRRLDLLGRVEHEDVPEALPMEPPERPPQLRLLVADDVRAEVPVGSLAGCAPGRASRAGRARWPPAGSGTAGPARPAACGPRAGRWWRRSPSAAPGPAACRR